MEKFQYKFNQTAIIGDRIFTDVLVGNRLGLYTVLVRPIGKNGMKAETALFQNIEILKWALIGQLNSIILSSFLFFITLTSISYH